MKLSVKEKHLESFLSHKKKRIVFDLYVIFLINEEKEFRKSIKEILMKK